MTSGYKDKEHYRVKDGVWGTKEGDSKGLFFVPLWNRPSTILRILCAPMDGEWQHVSVSLPNRCPTYTEMDMVIEMFWGKDVTVVQFHVKESQKINNCSTCLHLWKKRDEEYELPPSILVGLK
jgi:hypothetical protein